MLLAVAFYLPWRTGALRCAGTVLRISRFLFFDFHSFVQTETSRSCRLSDAAHHKSIVVRGKMDDDLVRRTQSGRIRG